jgi:hypothetical protein
VRRSTTGALIVRVQGGQVFAEYAVHAEGAKHKYDI